MACKPVLVVDDDDDLRATACEVLEAEGYKALRASNGNDALDVLLACSREGLPGCIILDLMMPVMDGVTFMRRLSQEHPDIARSLSIFVWTAKGKVDAELPMPVEILKKPVDIDELIAAVERHCGRPG